MPPDCIVKTKKIINKGCEKSMILLDDYKLKLADAQKMLKEAGDSL